MIDAREKAQLEAFKGLEQAMGDAIRMASVNNDFIENLSSDRKGDYRIFTLTVEENENLTFLAAHTLEMAEKLHRAYYACFDMSAADKAS
jgi:hypothetical protein